MCASKKKKKMKEKAFDLKKKNVFIKLRLIECNQGGGFFGFN